MMLVVVGTILVFIFRHSIKIVLKTLVTWLLTYFCPSGSLLVLSWILAGFCFKFFLYFGFRFAIFSRKLLFLDAILIASFPFTEVKKQAEMANDLQTKHGRRLVHLYFVQWTEKTRQMQQAKDLHNRTVLKRFVTTKNCVFTATPLTYLDSNFGQRQNRQFSVRGDRITNELQMLAMRKASCCTTRFNCRTTL